MVLLLCLPVIGFAQKTVTGTVVDNTTGEALPFAGITVAGTTAGVLTAEDGTFSINVQSDDAILQFSFIGYETLELKANTKEKMLIRLEPTATTLDEVLVTGYQTISRERATGAFAKVGPKQLETQRLDNLSSVLEGRVAGYNQGMIRGVTSMQGLSSPLYVIDGFPVEKTIANGLGSYIDYKGGVPDLNMEDIEDVTVLKDAAATSIYGARAANGVVVIVTKKAKKDRIDVSFSSTLTMRPYEYYTGHLADAATMIGLEKEWAAMNPMLQGAGAQAYAQNMLDNATYYQAKGAQAILRYHAGLISEQEMNRIFEQLSSKGHQYYDDIAKHGKRNPFTQQYNLSIGSGTEKNSFNASLSYRHNREEDIYSSDQSLGLNLQNTTKITSWLSLDVGTYLNYGNGSNQTYDLTNPGYNYMPYNSLVNEDGTPYTYRAADRYALYELGKLSDYNLYSMDITPLDELSKNLRKNKDFSNRTFARLNFTFTDWLKYSAAIQYEVGEYRNTQLQDKTSFAVRNKVNSFATDNDYDGVAEYNLPYGNIYTDARNSTRAYNFRQQLDFSKTFADDHAVTAIAGMEIRENKVDYSSRTLYGYDPDLLTFTLIDEHALSALYGTLWSRPYFSPNDVAKIQEREDRFVSIYGNAAYTYKSKYMLTGSIRWDRTNLFATGSKYQNRPIWSVGAGWNIDKESFLDGSFVDMLKLRASYGIGGNIAKNSAPYMTAYYGSNTQVGGISGTIQSRPNPNLRWEKTTTANIGLDFALFNNRLNGTIDYYNKNSVDLLANINGVPVEGWGFSTYAINNGEMTNNGIELTLSGDIIATKDWNWSVTGMFAHNKNEVTYVNVKAPVLFIFMDYPSEYPRIGNPLNSIYGYNWAGLSAEGAPQIYDATGAITEHRPYEIDDAVYLGTSVPTYNGSFQMNLRYKNWELAALVLFEGGHVMRNTNLPWFDMGTAYANPVNNGQVNKNIVDRWKQPGDEAHTDIPRYVSPESPDYNADSYDLWAKSSACILDAANLRLGNLTLTYHIPAELCRKISLKNARVMLGMENVFMIAKSSEAKLMLGGYVKPNYLCSIHLNF
jgi:TonB-linked SusC/RagA family outer membrane protein